MAKRTAEEVESILRGYLARRDHGGRVGLEKYEFDIKIPQRIVIPPRAIEFFGQEMVDDLVDSEPQGRLEILVADILRNYGWAEDWYQSGRSGGWLVISTNEPVTDDWDMRLARGRIKDLMEITNLIDEARKRLIRDLESEDWWVENEGLPWDQEKSVKSWRPK